MTTDEQQREIVEKTQITDLLLRYFAAIDDKSLDMEIVKATFTSDAKIIRPDNSEIVGQENILDGHLKSFARFKATHHVITNIIVDISNHLATLRSNVIANHLWADDENNPSLNNKHFLANGVLSAKAVKVDDHWRISELKKSRHLAYRRWNERNIKFCTFQRLTTTR